MSRTLRGLKEGQLAGQDLAALSFGRPTPNPEPDPVLDATRFTEAAREAVHEVVRAALSCSEEAAASSLMSSTAAAVPEGRRPEAKAAAAVPEGCRPQTKATAAAVPAEERRTEAVSKE